MLDPLAFVWGLRMPATVFLRLLLRSAIICVLLSLVSACAPAHTQVPQTLPATSQTRGGMTMPQTFEGVWYRPGDQEVNVAGMLTVGEQAIEFKTEKETMKILLKDIRSVSLGTLEADPLDQWVLPVLVRYGQAEAPSLAAFKGGGDTRLLYAAIKEAVDSFAILDALKKAAEAGVPYAELKVLSETFFLIKFYYVDEVNGQALAHAAIQGILALRPSGEPSPSAQDLIHGAIQSMLEAVDLHGAFMPPEVFKEMQVETPGSGGVGLEITVKEHQLTVVAPIEGAPADRAEIQPGDRIVKIDGQPTNDMTLMKAVRKMRGPRGTQVTLTIQRGEQEPFDLTLTREIIAIKSVKAQDLGDGIGYVRLISFQEGTARDLQTALEELEKKGMTALVLDLRNNPGGLLNQAVQVAELFLEKDQLIVYTTGRARDQNLRFIAEGQHRVWKVPMVVLVNKGSAAGSEIVAGALQDWKRALILGIPTFGRASIQKVIPLSDGSGLRLTTARFFTPKYHSIQDKGLTPDLVVEPPPPEGVAGDLKSDVQLQRAVEILKTSRPAEESSSSSKSALLRELMTIINFDKRADDSMQQISAQLEPLLPARIEREFLRRISKDERFRGLTDTQRNALLQLIRDFGMRLFAKFKDAVPKRIPIKKFLEDTYFSLYDKFFTESEIRDLISFYKSSIGKKLLEVEPQITAEVFKETFNTIDPKLDELAFEIIQQETPTFIEEAKKVLGEFY